MITCELVKHEFMHISTPVL